MAITLMLVMAALTAGCASYRPKPVDDTALMQQAQKQSQDGVTVTVAVPGAKEAAAIFGVNLDRREIQPVWVRIVNNSDINYLFLPADMDPNYFSPQEAAWMSRSGYSAQGKRDMQVHFNDLRMRLYIPAGKTVEGYVFTNKDYGVKYVSVVLYRPGKTKSFEFVIEVPGIKADYTQVEFDKVVPPQSRHEVNLEQLRQALEAYPCCALGPDGKTPADPLNIVVIGPVNGVVFHPFVQRGWAPTETVSGSSVVRTIGSSLFGTRYRTSPVSALYLNGRKQDIALQKARGSVDERNHLRLWLTPLLYKGNSVWIGQISRDIGVRLSSKTVVTHKIDPQVDEARNYLVQDMLLSGRMAGFGYVGGVGAATARDPRYNYTLDPYFTDGLRAVLFLSKERVSPDSLKFVPWDWPPAVGKQRLP